MSNHSQKLSNRSQKMLKSRFKSQSRFGFAQHWHQQMAVSKLQWAESWPANKQMFAFHISITGSLKCYVTGDFEAPCRRSGMTFLRSQWQRLFRTCTNICSCAGGHWTFHITDIPYLFNDRNLSFKQLFNHWSLFSTYNSSVLLISCC